MKRATRQRLWLLLGAVALLALASWQWHRDATNAPGNLLTIAPAAISHIELRIGKSAAMHYEKRDGHWWHIDGTPALVDDGSLDDLTAIAAAPVLKWRPANDFELAKIGLDPPRAVLRLDDQTLSFGEIATIGPLRYVQVGERVALVSLKYTPRSPANATIRAN
ncbi:MAG: hypothetical protein WA777_14685 [Rhodanobacter sp.]